MSQVYEVKAKPSTAQKTTPTTLDTMTTYESPVAQPISWLLDYVFESISDRLDVKPVEVEEDTIHLKEYLMKEDEPYPFTIKNRVYYVTRSKGKTKLFELKE